MSKIFLVVAFIANIFVANVFGGAYEWGGLGSRSQSMAGAFAGLADDWTAVYWNPAGLSQLQGMGIGIEFLSPHPTLKDSNSLSNYSIVDSAFDPIYQRDIFTQLSNMEPTQFNKSKVSYDLYYLGGVAGYWNVSDTILAIGFYIPVGYYLDWDDIMLFGDGSINARLFQELYVTTTNISAARQITERLSLGGGINFLYGRITYEATKSVTNSGLPNYDYSYSYDSEADGTGFEGVFGFLYKINDLLKMGGVYRSGGTIDLKGDARIRSTFLGVSESVFVQRFQQPATYGLGLAFQYSPNLIMTTDWHRTCWSEFNVDITYASPSIDLSNLKYSQGWNDSNRYRLGAEWKPSAQWSLRGGYFFDESPLENESVSLSHIPGVDRHNFTFGFGRTIGKNLVLDGILGYAFGNRKVGGVDYSQEVFCFGLSVAFRV